MSQTDLADVTIKITSLINKHLAENPECVHCKELFKEVIA